jgi:hypothetical protein
MKKILMKNKNLQKKSKQKLTNGTKKEMHKKKQRRKLTQKSLI